VERGGGGGDNTTGMDVEYVRACAHICARTRAREVGPGKIGRSGDLGGAMTELHYDSTLKSASQIHVRVY